MSRDVGGTLEGISGMAENKGTRSPRPSSPGIIGDQQKGQEMVTLRLSKQC